MSSIRFKLNEGTTAASIIPLVIRSFFQWSARYWIPNIFARYAQMALYAIFYRAAAQRPKFNSTRFWRDRQRLYKLAVIAMFVLTLYQADSNIRREPNFYRLLGVRHDADHKAARARLRTLAKRYHPDKVTPDMEHLATETFFRLQTAANVIDDADLRRVYNNGGPLALDCKGECSVDDKHISRAFLRRISFYITCIAEAAVLMRKGNWRWMWCPCTLIIILAIVEVHAELTNPLLGMVAHSVATFLELTRLSNRYLNFELVTLLRAVIKASFVAIAQLRRMKTAGHMGTVEPLESIDEGKKVT